MNLRTEQDARTKWCPFARIADPWRWAEQATQGQLPVAAVNRGSDAVTDGARCVAADCMAWRFVFEREDIPKEKLEKLHSPAAFALATVEQPVLDPPRGYCGLATKVEWKP